jgi:hypothetical protein
VIGLKFGDLAMVVASMVVVFALVAFPLDMVLFSALGISGMSNVDGNLFSFIISAFLSALVSGYIFADKIREARRQAIVGVTVLWAAFMTLVATVVPATLADWGASAKEEYLAAFSGTSLSSKEWVSWEMMYTDMFLLIVVGFGLILSLIGLYVGSMLRKPKKT